MFMQHFLQQLLYHSVQEDHILLESAGASSSSVTLQLILKLALRQITMPKVGAASPTAFSTPLGREQHCKTRQKRYGPRVLGTAG